MLRSFTVENRRSKKRQEGIYVYIYTWISRHRCHSKGNGASRWSSTSNKDFALIWSAGFDRLSRNSSTNGQGSSHFLFLDEFSDSGIDRFWFGERGWVWKETIASFAWKLVDNFSVALSIHRELEFYNIQMGGYIGWRVINIEFGHNWRKNLIAASFVLKVQLKETCPTYAWRALQVGYRSLSLFN